MKDPYLRCDKCNQRVTAEMDDKRHCELIDAIERSRSELRARCAALERVVKAARIIDALYSGEAVPSIAVLKDALAALDAKTVRIQTEGEAKGDAEYRAGDSPKRGNGKAGDK